MTQLVEQVKKLKKQYEGLTIQNVEWDLDPCFMGEPLIPRVLKNLSSYVDTRLRDYSSILGSIPATNLPQGRLTYDDHVSQETLIQPVAQQLNQISKQMEIRDAVIENMTEPSNDIRGVFRDDPYLHAHNPEDGPGPLIDDPELYDAYEKGSTWRVRRLNQGQPGSAYPSPAIPPQLNIPETGYISEFSGDNEQDLNGGSISRAINSRNVQTQLREQQETQEMHQITERGLQVMRGVVEGVPPGTTLNAPYGHTGDFQVLSGGCTPQARQRYRDSFIRDRHISFRILPELPFSEGRLISYVTSYTVEHNTMKIKARVMTASNNFKMEDDLWYNLSTSGEGQNFDTVRDIIQNTLKANLCILMKSRAMPLPKDIKESERIAMETLREMISEQEFRNYLRYGFILVKGQSGKIYQVSRQNSHTKVWNRGALVEEVCVRINRQIEVPPTDNVIAFKVMIETSEDLFRNNGNIYNMSKTA